MTKNWLVEIDKTSTPTTQTNWTLFYLFYIKKSIPDVFLLGLGMGRLTKAYKLTYGLRQPKHTVVNSPVYSNFLETEFKLIYKNTTTFKRFVLPSNVEPKVLTSQHTQIRLLKMFRSYLIMNSASNSTLTVPHFSFKHFYLGYRRGGLAVLNVNKLFSRWKDAYYLMFNLFYYEINILIFSTSFFKSEVLSLNWQVMTRFRFMWRYTKPFLTLKSNKITTYGDFIFYRLNLLGLRIGLVVDVLYHSKTIYYLHRAGFYSVGLVPVNHNINTLNFAIPMSSDSLLTQIFFIRFLSVIQQNSKTLKYESCKNLWSNFNL